MTRLLTLGALFALTTALAACGGSNHNVKLPDGTRQAGLAAGAMQLAPVPAADEALAAQRAAQWQAILANPGTPGQDYNPKCFDVSFVIGAAVPAQFAGLKPAAGLRAAEQTNPMLRHDKAYEALADAVSARYGMLIRQQVYRDGIRLASFELPAGADRALLLAQLKREFANAIEWATYSRLSHLVLEPNDPWYLSSTASDGDQWGARRIGCSAAWDYTRGTPGLRIAVVDSGVRVTHQELASQVIDINSPEFSSFDFDLANGGGDRTPEDTDGHGTGVAGIVGAQGNNNRTLIGVANLCQIIPVKVGNGEVFNSANSVAGIMVALDAGAKVINASWGSSGIYPPEEPAVNQVTLAGILFVAAAGNDGVTADFYPAAYTNALCVGSTGGSDSRSSFSNYGTYVDIAAPGEGAGSVPWGITMCGAGSDIDYVYGSGTSMAAPYVAGAAGLMWSFEPTLTIPEMRTLLETTGAPTTGFSSASVKRLDLAAALAGIGAVRIALPELKQVIQSGTVTLIPLIYGDPDRVDVYFNGILVDSTTTGPPYSFNVDTSTIAFGRGAVEFRAFKGGDFFSQTMLLLVDNTAGAFPLAEDFEEVSRSLYPLDVRGYHLDLLKALKAIPDGLWMQDEVAYGGGAQWTDQASGASSGVICEHLGDASNSYGNYELDPLISQRLDLLGVAAPTLVFYQHYNIEDGGSAFDKAWVYVTADKGKTFTPATKKGGGQAYYTGYQAAWTKTEIDLSAFKNQKINLVFVLESDELGAGEQPQPTPAGWWIDNITVAENYVEDIPTIGSVTPAADSAVGLVPEVGTLNVSISQPHNVAKVRYMLDCQPLGTVDTYDVTVNVDTLPFSGQITLPNVHNQLANLRVQYFDAANTPGPEKFIPIWIFNQLGDTNGDGLVGDGDIQTYAGKVGLTSADTGYIPLLDSDLNGTIEEMDAAMVGYHWGETYTAP